MNDTANTDFANAIKATQGKGLVKRKTFKMNENTGTGAGKEAKSESGTFSKKPAPPKKTPKPAGDGKLSYDSVAKNLRKRSVILANVLKYGIEEFSQYEIAELQNCIEDVQEINSIAVDPVSPNADSKIEGSDSEDSVPGEGVIRFDILFNIRHPGDKERVMLTINIEVQPLGDILEYELLSRCVYYGSRMISRQKDLVFFNQDYDSIRKVYCLWLRPSLDCKNSLVEFGFGVLRSFGPARELSEDLRPYYDKIRFAIITFSNNDPENREKIIEFLSALLIDDKTLEYRRKILEHEFSIPMTKEISEEMESMDSMSRAIMNESRAQGLEEGLAKGLAQGRKEMQQEMQKKLDDMNTKVQEQTLASIRTVMDIGNISAEKAMDRIGIPESDQAMYLELLRKS